MELVGISEGISLFVMTLTSFWTSYSLLHGFPYVYFSTFGTLGIRQRGDNKSIRTSEREFKFAQMNFLYV